MGDLLARSAPPPVDVEGMRETLLGPDGVTAQRTSFTPDDLLVAVCLTGPEPPHWAAPGAVLVVTR